MITELPTTCWLVIDDLGEPDGVGGMVPHYPTKADAQAAVRDRSTDRPGVRLAVREQPLPCVVAACDGCRYEFDEDEGYEHFDGTDHVVAALRGCGWAVDAETGVWCSSCACAQLGHDPMASGDEARCRRCWLAMPGFVPLTLFGTVP